MSAIFFLLAILFLIHEIGIFLNPDKSVNIIENFKDKDFLKSKKHSSGEKAQGCLYALANLFYLFWGVIGLAFSSQWVPFLFLFVIGIVSGLVQKGLSMKNLQRSKFALGLRSLDSAVCAFVLFDIFMTHFNGDFWGSGMLKTILGL
ncbi:hypothetical protein EBR43_02840 [bacterium]|nr:hypothetical protein [bacterium]